MSNPLIGAKVLAINPEADQLHEAGLRAELSGNYNQARASFAAARQVLTASPWTADVVVQDARITRDDGFTDVRAAIEGSDPWLLERAVSTISRSFEAIAHLVGDTAFIGTEQLSADQMSRQARREVLAEHGATVSLLGRVATVQEVMFNNDFRDTGGTEQQSIDETPRMYKLAHSFLRRGNNGYYRVSNAMAGARQERLNGRLTGVAGWLGRAGVSLAWTAFRDTGNLKAAVRTAGSRARHLRSYRAAARSVATHP